jgi:hypothetical protein
MNRYAPLLVAIITTTVHVSTALDTKSVFGTCPQSSNLEDKPGVAGKLAQAQDYQIWHEEQCNAANSITQDLQSMPLLRHAEEIFQRLGHRSNETIHAYPFCTFVKYAALHPHRSEAAHLDSHGTDG